MELFFLAVYKYNLVLQKQPTSWIFLLFYLRKCKAEETITALIK